MNFILQNTPEMALSNHPLFVEVQRLYPHLNIDVNNAPKGKSLRDVDLGNLSSEDYIIGNMFKKVRNDLGLEPTTALVKSTLADLERNREQRIKLRYILDNVHSNTPLAKVLLKARDIVHELFKDFDPFKISPRLTTGATEFLEAGADVFTRLRSANSKSLNSLLKLKNGNALKAIYLYKVGAVDPTRESRVYDSSTRTWSLIPQDKQDGSYVLFASVPKTALIDRPIGYHEPLQLAVQCGIGDYHAACLKTVGIDFEHAQDYHRELAQIYSMYPGELATMDQSNASQNILRDLVEFLYPTDLFSLMDAVTPRLLRIDGRDYHLDMMSAQGNGYNSGMQTVVYYSLLSAIAWFKNVKTRIYQYGDDSIFSAELFNPAVTVFTALGFQVNTEKSFLGHVLESCGMDAKDGENIRPYYVKSLPQTPRDWYHVCNGIYRVGYANNSNSWRSTAFKRLWLWCISNVPANQRFYGPTEYGDDVITNSNSSKYCYNSSGTKIRAFGTSSGSGKRYTQVTNGLSGANILSNLPAPSLSGSGLRHSNKLGHYYPQVIGIRETIYGLQWLPYPVPLIKDDDDVDLIFETFNLKSSEMVENYHSKLYAKRWMLIQALKRYATKRMDIESKVDINLMF